MCVSAYFENWLALLVSVGAITMQSELNSRIQIPLTPVCLRLLVDPDPKFLCLKLQASEEGLLNQYDALLEKMRYVMTVPAHTSAHACLCMMLPVKVSWTTSIWSDVENKNE